MHRSMDPSELLRKIKEHDTEADVFLETKVKSSVLRIIRNHRLGYQEDDLWQEIRTQVWRKIDTCLATSEDTLKNWIRSIAYHHCRNFLRSEKRLPILLQYSPEAENQQEPVATEPAPDLAYLEMGRTLDRALKNKFERTVIELRYVHDYTPTEIAQKLHKSVNTVNTSLLRAKRHLRNYLLDVHQPRGQFVLNKERQRI